ITIDITSMKPSIHVSQDWETVWPRVNEGSFVIQHKGLYYMTYSANSYESQHYGIGFATSKSVEGPWTKYDKNPIFQMPEDLVGVGHSAMFRDKEGKLRIAFHAHHSKEKIHPRAMYIATVDFSKDKLPVMQITGKVLRPKLKYGGIAKSIITNFIYASINLSYSIYNIFLVNINCNYIFTILLIIKLIFLQFIQYT